MNVVSIKIAGHESPLELQMDSVDAARMYGLIDEPFAASISDPGSVTAVGVCASPFTIRLPLAMVDRISLEGPSGHEMASRQRQSGGGVSGQ